MHPTDTDRAAPLSLPGEPQCAASELKALRFLVDAAVVLTRSLDLATTIARTAAAPVPALADWSVVYLADADGRLERRDGAAASRRGEVLVRAARAVGRLAPQANGAIARVVRTGLTEVVPHDAAHPAAAIASMDPELQVLAGELGAGTSLVLPLQAKGNALGAMVLTMAGRRGAYGAPAIRLAEELARLAAQAIGNAQHHEQLRSAARASADGRRTILLVDDEPAIRAVLRRTLERCGYRVLEAQNGRHALDVARAYDAPIDLVLTDVVMPELDGRACVEQLRKLRVDLEALYMSGYAPREILNRGLDVSRVPFLAKPFTPDVVARRVRALVEGAPRN